MKSTTLARTCDFMPLIKTSGWGYFPCQKNVQKERTWSSQNVFVELKLFSILADEGHIGKLSVLPQLFEGCSHILLEIIPPHTKLLWLLHIGDNNTDIIIYHRYVSLYYDVLITFILHHIKILSCRVISVIMPPPLGCKTGHNYGKSFPSIFWEFFLDLFWLGHVHLGVNGCHREVCISNVKK